MVFYIQVASNSWHNVELMLQESCIDNSGGLIVYSTVGVDSIQHVMNGEDPSNVPVLPLGFSVVPWGLSNDLVVPGDYDGDNKTDIAVVREGTTPTSNLVWYIQQSSNGALYATTFGLTASDLNAQGDYDGDGRTDVAVWRNSNGVFYIQRTTDPVNIQVVLWGQANDFPIASYDSH